MKKFNLFLTAAATLALAGCANVAGGPRTATGDAPSNAVRTENLAARAAGTRRVDMLPFIDVTTERAVGQTIPLEDSYTRLVAVGVIQNTGSGSNEISVRDYDAEDRPWWARWLLGRSVSRVLTIKATVDRPELDVTVPLASASHQSNSTAGERWETEINGRRNLTPYFRVDASTSMSLTASVNASSSTQNNVTGAVLGVVQQAAALVAPKSTLLTSLNSDRVKKASDFVDQSISTLFGQTIIERSVNDFRLDDYASEPYVKIEARFPMQRDITSGVGYVIGEWEVYLEAPIISIFNSVPRCAASARQGICNHSNHARQQAYHAYRGLSPYTVLGLDVAENIDLEASLRAQSNIATSLGTANGADGDERAAAARTLCNQIAAHAEGLGLNRFDVAVVVWAVAHSELVTSAVGNSLRLADTCNASALAEIVGPDAAAPPPGPPAEASDDDTQPTAR